MSTMAGFDLVVEVSKGTALRLIQANVKLGGVSLNPPFSLEVPIAFGGDSYAAVIVKSMFLELVGNQEFNLVLRFENTSIIVQSPSLTITQLDGTVTIGGTLQLLDAGAPNKNVLATDLHAAAATVAFSASAQQHISAAIAGLPIDVAAVTAFAQSSVQTFIRSAGVQIIPQPVFTVDPGNIGSLSQGRFNRLLLHNIGTQAIGLFGMLIPDKPTGDPVQKTFSLLPPNHDVCIEVGSDAFHRLIFCPNLPHTGPVSSLPPSCGSGTLEHDGITFNNISDSLANGRIDVNGNFTKSGTCYDADGSFHGAITLSVNKSMISAHVAVDEPSIDVHVPWYCTLGEVLLGPIGLLIASSIESAAKHSGDNLQSALAAFGGGGALVFGAGGFPGAAFDSASITHEAIILSGTIDVPLPIADAPGIEIAGSVTNSEQDILSSGTYVVPDGCMKGEYPYVETAQQQTAAYVLIPTLLSEPLSLEWHLECWQGYWGYNSAPKLVSQAILSGGAGKVALDGVTTAFPLPLPGGSTVVQPVHIAYKTGSKFIRLSNVPAEGNYGFILTVKATDPAGQVAHAQIGVGFLGNLVTILGSYQAKLAECIPELLEKLKRISIDRVVVIPRWVPVNKPDPGELVELIRFLAAQATEETDHFLLHAVLAHGSSYFQALASREAVDNLANHQVNLEPLSRA